MGSQRLAKLTPKRAAFVADRVAKFPSRGEGNTLVVKDLAANIIGPITKTCSFIQCLSNQSVTNALKYLVDFRNDFFIKGSSPNDVFNKYGISPRNNLPLGELEHIAQKRLMESLVAQQKSTESALAANDALVQSFVDIMAKYMDRSKIRSANRDKIAENIKKEDPHDIAKTMLKNIIANLIDRIVDSAGGTSSPKKRGKVKDKIREDFALKLVSAIDRLAREKRILPSDIPSQIPQWVEELEEIRKKYIIK